MKNKLIVLLLLLPISTMLATTPKDNAEKDFKKYIGHLINQEFEQSMDYLYPELFDLISREDMLLTMEQTFNSPDILISIAEPTVNSVGEIEKIDSMFFVKLNYSHTMIMRFSNTDSLETQQERDSRDEMTLISLGGTFGEENVSYDSTSSSFDIFTTKDSYGKSKDGKTSWKFIDIDPNNMVLLEALLPAKLLQKINAE